MACIRTMTIRLRKVEARIHAYELLCRVVDNPDHIRRYHRIIRTAKSDALQLRRRIDSKRKKIASKRPKTNVTVIVA